MSPTSPRPDLTGFVLVDKAPGPTSHDVVDAVRKALAMRRVGHAGTLDPPASGLVVVGVGGATRLLRFVQDQPKAYETTGLLGVRTTTLDADGEVMSTEPVDVTEEALRSALPDFTGEISQTPPAVSAVKVGGERAYKRAARGEDVRMEPRPVTVHALELTSFDQPRFSLRIRCSSGTYVRSLVADIGDALGCGAHVLELRRTSIGSLDVADAVGMEDVSQRSIISVPDGLPDLPRIEVDASTAERLRNDQRVPADEADGERLAVAGADAVGVVRSDGGILRPVVMLGVSS